MFDPEIVEIGETEWSTPAMQRLRIAIPEYNRRYNLYRMWENPSGWMTFLKAYRRKHPKPHNLREGAALVKAAGAEYRKMMHRNPIFGFGYARKDGLLFGAIALAVLTAASRMMKR